MVDSNLYALVISGKPTDEDLEKTWEQIRLQYADAMKDTEYLNYVMIRRQVLNLQLMLDQVKMAIEILTDYYCEYFKDSLNKLLGASLKFDASDAQSYDRDLKSAVMRSKGYEFELRLKLNALEGLRTKMEAKGGKPSREYYSGMLLTMENFYRREVSEEKTTVYKFCEMYRRINEQVELMKRKK